jgi:hypothetical protein
MIKIFIFIVFIFNILACGPVQKAASKKNTPIDNTFSCLSSQSTCEVNSTLGAFKIKFSGETSQGKIKTELPFSIKLKFNPAQEKYKIKTISSYLEGKSMFMGKIPVLFNNNSTNGFIAESLLASCTEEVMTWRIWFSIDIDSGDEIHQQSFFIDFDSERL